MKIFVVFFLSRGNIHVHLDDRDSRWKYKIRLYIEHAVAT